MADTRSARSALVFDFPLTAIKERTPASRLAVDLGLYVLLLGLATVADHRCATLRVFLWRITEEVIRGIDLVTMGDQFQHQRCAGFTVFRELAGSQEQTRSAVAQDVGVVDLLAFELRHLHRVHFRRRRFTAFQQFAGVLALTVGAAEELAETAGLELHLAATLVAIQARAFVALDTVLALFYFITAAIWVIAADMQLAGFIEQVGVHRGRADRTAVLAKQHARLRLTLVIRGNFVARHQIDGGLAALFRRQCITGTTEEYAER